MNVKLQNVLSALCGPWIENEADIVIMSAHVTKRKHMISRMRQQGTTSKSAKTSFTQSRVNTQPRLTATLSPTREPNAHPRDLIADVRKNGKLGTTSKGFPQYNKLGSVRHECQLHDVLSGPWLEMCGCPRVHMNQP